MSFKLKLCSFVSVPSLFKKEINAFDSLSVLNDLSYMYCLWMSVMGIL